MGPGGAVFRFDPVPICPHRQLTPPMKEIRRDCESGAVAERADKMTVVHPTAKKGTFGQSRSRCRCVCGGQRSGHPKQRPTTIQARGAMTAKRAKPHG